MKRKLQTRESSIELQDKELDAVSAGAYTGTEFRSSRSAKQPVGSRKINLAGSSGKLVIQVNIDLGEDFSP